ncbi:MAG: hypothetical protein B7Z73_03320 [Planctomycetia bacterium 21-64-5]|nr:MAG: hypothetical protein B7Z73_03320 [Planctomycetia bacterium 21-64-5]
MRTPDWQSPDGRIELHCCDAADLLRSLQPQSVDIAVSSPPYNTLPRDTRAYGFRRRKRRTDDGWLAKVSQQGYADQLPDWQAGRYHRLTLDRGLAIATAQHRLVL